MIHVIVGAPCSGKSTYVRENAKSGDLIVDFDKIAEALGATKSHEAEGIVKEAAFAARESAINIAFGNKDADSWIIHTSPSAEKMKLYEDAGAEIVTLDTDKETCLERARSDGRPQRSFDGIEKYFSEEKGGPKMDHLTKNFNVKAAEDGGSVSGYFSTFDEIPDSYGDIVSPGAFKATLARRKESGHPFPICWNHDLNQIIGFVNAEDIEEDDHGPLMKNGHFLDTPLAQEKRELVKAGVIYQFSFAYDVLKASAPTAEQKKAGIMNVLDEVELFEISIVPIPANPRAEVTEIKSGRRNSAKDEQTIKDVISALQALVNAEEEPDEGKDNPEANSAAAEEEQKESNPKKAALLEYIKSMEKEDDDE